MKFCCNGHDENILLSRLPGYFMQKVFFKLLDYKIRRIRKCGDSVTIGQGVTGAVGRRFHSLIQ